jgi:hypothetical protein
VFSPPSLLNKLSAGGLHPNKQGAKLLISFYRKLIPVPPVAFSSDSGRQNPFSTYAAAAVQPPPQAQDTQTRRSQPQWHPPSAPVSNVPFSSGPVYLGVGHSVPPSNVAATHPTHHEFSGNNNELAWHIASAVANALHHRDYKQLYPQ